MEPMTARALLALQICSGGIGSLEEFRAYEKSLKLPLGRYLTGFEVARWIRHNLPRRELKNPSEAESDDMDKMWREFDRDHRHCAPQISVEEVHKWEDWAMAHFKS